MIEQPEPFSVTMRGPNGPYTMSFLQSPDEGELRVTHGSMTMRWSVENCERTDGGWRLAGLTRGTTDLWGDTYWFELHTQAPAHTDYYVKELIRRDDAEA